MPHYFVDPDRIRALFNALAAAFQAGPPLAQGQATADALAFAYEKIAELKARVRALESRTAN